MRRFTAPIVLLIVVPSCARAPMAVAPSPISLHSSRAADDASRGAAMALMGVGFRVVPTDSTGKTLVATRTATGNGNEAYVVCTVPMRVASTRQTALTISLKIVPSASGSDITIDSKVMTSYSAESGDSSSPIATASMNAANATDCVSNGKVEKQLADALR